MGSGEGRGVGRGVGFAEGSGVGAGEGPGVGSSDGAGVGSGVGVALGAGVAGAQDVQLVEIRRRPRCRGLPDVSRASNEVSRRRSPLIPGA